MPIAAWPRACGTPRPMGAAALPVLAIRSGRLRCAALDRSFVPASHALARLSRIVKFQPSRPGRLHQHRLQRWPLQLRWRRLFHKCIHAARKPLVARSGTALPEPGSTALTGRAPYTLAAAATGLRGVHHRNPVMSLTRGRHLCSGAVPSQRPVRPSVWATQPAQTRLHRALFESCLFSVSHQTRAIGTPGREGPLAGSGSKAHIASASACGLSACGAIPFCLRIWVSH